MKEPSLSRQWKPNPRLRYFDPASVQEIEPMPKIAPIFVLSLGVSALTPAAFAQNPTSNRASNIVASDTVSPIAPALPSPDLGPGAPPEAFLHAARSALASGRTGEAQQAMEMAETRLLDRSTPLFQTDDPSRNPLIHQIGEARRALGNGDRAQSMRLLDQAIALAANSPRAN
jgi:hypothetical protein